MTRPEHRPGGDAGETVAVDEAVEPSFSEQLSEQLGGWRGLVESSIPVTVFVIANVIWDLRPALVISVASGLVIAVFRLSRRQSVRHAVNGLVGIFLGAVIAWRSGSARDFYLPGIYYTAGYGAALLISVGARWPMVGWIWSIMLDGGRTRWRQDPVLLRAFSWLTVLWAVTYLIKAAVQYGLWRANEAEWLGVTRLAIGWPLYALLLAITVWAVRRVLRSQEQAAAQA